MLSSVVSLCTMSPVCVREMQWTRRKSLLSVMEIASYKWTERERERIKVRCASVGGELFTFAATFIQQHEHESKETSTLVCNGNISPVDNQQWEDTWIQPCFVSWITWCVSLSDLDCYQAFNLLQLSLYLILIYSLLVWLSFSFRFRSFSPYACVSSRVNVCYEWPSAKITVSDADMLTLLLL